MKAGKLSNGFEYQIDEVIFDDMRFLDALAEADEGDPLAASRVCNMLLGKEQKKSLYKMLANEDGRVPIEAALNCVREIMEALGDESKN
jgi:hypothetical protein